MPETLEGLLDLKAGHEVQSRVWLRQAEVHFRFRRSTNLQAPLIVRFHGAIKRDSRPLPAFQKNLSQFTNSAHQITICDPTMMSREGFSCSWYAGHEGLDTQGILREFLQNVVSVLEPSRTIYLGSSGGGFAALYHSFYDPESIAVCMVPQTNLRQHFTPSSVDRYLAACWPGRSLEQVEEHVCLDVSTLYANGFSNTVIYIQSQGDHKHNSLQLLPFMNACLNTGESGKERLIVHSDYWGRPGHGGAVPPEAYIPWLRAAISVSSSEVDEILDAYSRLKHRYESDSDHARPRSPSSFSEQDVKMAEVIASKLLLRQSSEEGSET